jgi:ribosomal RNA assembly protein
MKRVFVKSLRKLIQNKKELEEKLNVKIDVKGREVLISGDKVKEYFAERVLESLDFPFDIEESLLLNNEDFMFEVFSIKEFTNRKDLDTIKGRIIGTKGKTLNVLKNLTGCFIALRDNNIAIIGSAEKFESAKQAIISLIQGSKQGNVYSYLEGRNSQENDFR